MSLPTNTSRPAPPQPKTVVLIPCLNEEITIGKVVRDFRVALPEAEIHVFDNNSTDGTAAAAKQAGAIVTAEKRPGKGFVVRSMFQSIEADIYVLVDGDDTYAASEVGQLIDPVMGNQADMVVGTRLSSYHGGSFPSLHVLGNHLLTGIVNRVFRQNLADMLSGYRVLSRELVKSLPILSAGFEVETELTTRSLAHGFIIREIPLIYRERPQGSHSKLHTFRDGFRVILSIVNITRTYRPLAFFGVFALFFMAMGLLSGWVVIVDFMEDRYVEHVPLAILATGCMILGFLFLGVGMLLDSINERIKELTRLINMQRQ